MAGAVVGRDEELGALSAFLDRGFADGPAGLALEGEAGIGKSTLWRAALEDARARGLRVLTTRPAEPEQGLAHAGLGDLFEPVLEDVLGELSPPRRRALEVALLLDDAGERPVDARALGVAVRSVLELLAADGVVVAVDDLQWLDSSSANALAFALRRIHGADVRLLWTRRVGEPNAGEAVEHALDDVARLAVGPLSLGALHVVMQRLLGRSLPRPTLLRLLEASGGNPFYALELARALRDDAVLDPTKPLPVPDRLEELVSARLAGFDGVAREALVLVSADARLTPAQLESAGVPSGALEEGIAGGVVEADGGTIRFTHPLLASGLYGSLTAAERRRAHARLAHVVSEPLARARHLALSAEAADAELAAALEEAAGRATALGAPGAAAELGEHAVRLTPSEATADLDRRSMLASRACLATGAVDRARVLAHELLDRAAPGAPRAEALALLAEVEGEGIDYATTLQREALLEPGAPAPLQAALHYELSLNVRFREGLKVAEEHARAAVELAEEVGDDSLRAKALAGLALVRLNAGKEGALELAEEAYALNAAAGEGPRPETDFALGHVLVWSGELERARDHLQGALAHWLERDERSAAYAYWYLAFTELRANRFELADRYADEARSLAAAYIHAGAESPQSFFPSTLIAAHRGDFERARRFADELVRRAELYQTRLTGVFGARGMIELWSGNPAEAVGLFETAEEMEHAADFGEPNMSWWRMEQVEALLEIGRVDDAAAKLDEWEAAADRLGRAWALAHACRCRGLVAAARGDVEEAVERLEEAVRAHDALGDDFGRGRALLALGVARRRARQKRAAREAIEAARAAFEGIGAAGWAQQAASELGRIGGRTRVEGLTPAEQRVADLVAAGRTNAEVAAALFLAERTVASHLTHVYAKLGVRSRTELSRTLESKVPTS
jgi:DNA-binding CsgD family transcriptional regulator